MKLKYKTGVNTTFLFLWCGALACILIPYIVYANTFIHDVVFWSLMAMPLGIFFLNRFFSKKISVHAFDTQDAFEGENPKIVLQVENGKWPCGDVVVKTETSSATIDMNARERKEFVLIIDATKRGVYSTPAVKVGTNFPFIMFHTMRLAKTQEHYAVYPEPEKNAPPFPENAFSQKKNRQGEDITSLRQYFYGDTLSSVDWKASARKNELVVREYEHPEHRDIVFSERDVVDMEKEKGLSRLAAWVVRAEHDGLRYELCLGEHRTGRGRGETHMKTCLRMLAGVP